MNAIKVDEDGGIRLSVLIPGDYYQPEIISADEIKLRRVQRPVGAARMTREEALNAIERSPLRFTRSWDELKQETRR
ncbi:MAG: hypothetical protein ABI651_18900 [Verrucomicrobiota bacterium]